LEATENANVEMARRQLNDAYDSFVAKFGAVSDRANTSAFRGDPDLPLLLSLENFDPETKRARKATIFHERTIQGPRAVTDIKTAQDALLISLGERGRVDLEHVASLLKRRVADVIPELKRVIFLNPQTDRWETEDEYLSGNVRAKLAAGLDFLAQNHTLLPFEKITSPPPPLEQFNEGIELTRGRQWQRVAIQP
jgi:hypothetical protein